MSLTIAYPIQEEAPLKALADSSPHQAGSIIGLAPLLKDAFHGVDLAPLANQWIAHARLNRDANTLLDLSLALELLRKPEQASAIQADALRLARHFRISNTAAEVRLRLLVIKTFGDLSANTPIECLLQNFDIAVELLYVGAEFALPDVFPEHDLLFIAIAESNENRPVLENLQHCLTAWPKPYLNAPDEILKLERNRVCNLISHIAEIVMPRTSPVDRATLQQLGQGEIQLDNLLPGAAFPIIVRPIDSHAGRGLIKAESPGDLIPYLDARVEAEFFISRFIDYSSADGLFRKYRIVIMRGQLFLCHMGISSHWMVHYPYAEMIADPVRRAEEAQAMATFDVDFARRHQNAFAAIHSQIQLDYFGFDCAEDRNGDLVIFEAASAMLVHAMDDPEIFPYKAGQMGKIIAAFCNMLKRHSPIAEG